LDWKLEVVIVPVSDLDRAKAFYADQLGFHVDVDQQVRPTMRIVQLTPPGSGCSITLGHSGLSDMRPGSLKGLQLVVSDVAAARQQLVDNGVEVTPVRHVDENGWQDGHGGPWNSFIFFDDPDGNSWAVQEQPAKP
jgi:catechol 2,3-dioxygenase-like lactoylglutathione lyase family enzyme